MGIRATASLFAFSTALTAQAEPERALPPLRAVQSAPLAAAAADGLAVEVVSEKGRPVANAIVGVLPKTWSAEQTAVLAQLDTVHADDANQRLAAVLLQFGERYRCDENGRAIVPASSTHLAACSGVLAGETLLTAAAKDGARVRLLTPRSVLVRVVGPDGKPVADLPLSIARGVFPGLRDTPTDARGECVLSLPPGESRDETAVVAQLAGARVRTPIAAPLPRTPIELRLPPFGTVRVIAYDDKEQPRSDVESVIVQWDNEQRPIRVQPDAKGDVVVRTALGVQFDVRVTLRGTTGGASTKCAGPTRAGELVVCDVRKTQGPPVLVFRILGLDGKAVPDGELSANLVGGRNSIGSDLRVGADGLVRLTLENREPEQRVFVRRRARNRGGEAGRSLGGAVFSVPQQLKAGDNPIADVHLVEEPVVAAGLVVDDVGKPMANMEVSASMGREAGPLVTGFAIVATDAEGRFEARDIGDGDNVTVVTRVTPAGYEPATATVARGTQDVRLVVARQGRVHLVFEGVPDTQHRLLFASLVAAGEAPNGAELEIRNGTAWIKKPAGRYDLVLSLRRTELEIARVPDVVVQRAADTEDPRLAPFAWRDHLAPVTITAVDEAGKPVAGAMVWCLFAMPGGGEAGGGGYTDEAGRFFALVPKTGARMRFDSTQATRGASYRAVDLANVTADQRVVLRPPLRVRVQLQGSRSVPGASSIQWQANLVEAPGRQGARFGNRNAQPAGDGTWDLQLDTPGTYELRMSIGIPSGDRSVTFAAVAWGTIEVKDTGELQTFPSSPSETATQQLEDLRAKLAK